MTKILAYAAFLLSLALAAGCGGTPDPAGPQPFGNNSNTTSTTTPPGYNSTPAEATNSSPTTTAPTATSAKGMVIVKLTEYKIEMPPSVPTGATTFTVSNAGKETHSFEVEGNGIEQEIKPALKVGETKTLQVNLKPGTYKVYCPVDGHKMLGMSRDLTVQ